MLSTEGGIDGLGCDMGYYLMRSMGSNMATTDISYPLVQDQNKEGLGTIQDYYTIDATDSNLVHMIDRKLKSAGKEFESFKKEGKTNERYWNRDHFKTISLRWHQSRIIQNIIYMGVETMIPIITSKPAEPMISLSVDTEDDTSDRVFVDLLQQVLMEKYNDPDYPQQELMEMLARHLLLYKIGIPKIIWGENIDDYILEYVHPHKMIISSDGHYNSDVWAAQYLEKSLRELLEMFPDKEQSIMANLFPGSTVTLEKFGDTPVGFWEYWCEDGEYVVWKMQDVVLQKKLNPDLLWKDDKTFDKENNHFSYPKKPVMFLNSQNLGRHIWDDTTPVTQCLPIQDGINLMQRIITDSAKDQGILVGAQELIDRDELYKYTGASDEKLSVKGADPTRALYRVPPKQLDAFVEQNLLHLLDMADNIMGTHSTTRGQISQNKTLGQDQLAKEADLGRIDLIVRGIERLSTEIYNWEVQMMITKYTPQHYMKYLGPDKGQQLYDLMKKYVKQGIKIIVKPGSTLPTDKVSQRAEAIQLAQMNKISDIDLFKRMDFPNPQELAKNAFMQARYPMLLFPDLAEQLQKMGIPMFMVEPKEILNYKDTPPDVKRQIEQRAGLQPSQLPELQPNNEAIAPDQGQGGQTQPPSPQQQAVDQSGMQQQPAQTASQPIQQDQTQPPVDQSGQPVDQSQQQPMQQPSGMNPNPQDPEHQMLEALLQGQEVPPFAGIPQEEWQHHLQIEFQFMASDQFLQLPQPIQVNIAKHVAAERQILMQQGGGQ